MSVAPQWEGPVICPHLRYALVYTGKEGGEAGTLEALFTNKTFADKCCNELNTFMGDGYYAVAKVFERSK